MDSVAGRTTLGVTTLLTVSSKASGELETKVHEKVLSPDRKMINIYCYCMPQRVRQHHLISCAEPCTATKFLHLLDNVDSALEVIRFGIFLALLAGNIGLCVLTGAFW